MIHLAPFYFLRHGQTDWNKQRLCQGQTDIPLNATGVSQAQNARSLLAGMPIATICSSPLGRARQTAEIVNDTLNCPLVFIDGLQEIGFGEFEGQPVAHESYAALLADAENWGGESLDAFIERVVSALEQALAYPGPVLVVSHGGAYWAIQARFGIEIGDSIANAHPVLLRRSENRDNQWAVETI